ncbi:hypothetical protein ACPCTO_03245 [Streptomyces olivoreticuli]
MVSKVAPNPAVRQAAKKAAKADLPKSAPAAPRTAIRKTPPAVMPGGSGPYYRALKAEFVLAMLLITLYPLVVSKVDPVKWAKRIVALWITFVILMTAAKLREGVAKIAAGLGGLVTLGLLVYGGSAKEGLLVTGALGSLGKALQAGGGAGAKKSSTESPAPTLGHGVEWPTGQSESWPTSSSGTATNNGFGSGSGKGTTSGGVVNA